MENTLIDTLEFTEWLNVNFKEIFWMFSSHHNSDCCEWHELDFSDSEKQFELVEKALTKIDKIEIYWEENMWVTFFFYDWEIRVWIFVPWRWSNNWYYSNDLTLIVELLNWFKKEYDITEYQNYYD